MPPFARSRRLSSTENRESALLLSLVVVAVVLPTLGFLWFVSKAMTNERAVMREKTSAFVDRHLSAARETVERALQRMGRAPSALLDAPALTDPQRLERVVAHGLADALIILDDQGAPRYPLMAPYVDVIDTMEIDEQALALRDQWHELTLNDFEDGLALLEQFPSQGCEHGRDLQGRLILPYLQWHTLSQLSRDSEAFPPLLDALKQSLTDPSVPWPVTQQRFLIQQVNDLDPSFDFPMNDALGLAHVALEHPLQLGSEGILERSPGTSATWRLLSRDRRYLLLFHEGTLHKLFQEMIQNDAATRDLAIQVAPNQPAESTHVPIGFRAPLWHVSMNPLSAPSIGDAAQRRAYTMAVVCILVALIGIIGTFAIRRFLAQSRLTQLRTDFLSTISHELKTPLASTRMLVDTLVEGKFSNDPARTQSYLEVIGKENARLSQLVENFLTYSQLESGRMPFHFEATLPEEIANQALDALENKLHQDHVNLEVHIEEDLPYIRADASTLTIALINLLDNAYKYTGQEKDIALHVQRQGSHVHFSVSDNGIGLTASQRERVRERFYRADSPQSSSTSGSGLGLSIVNDIIDAHGGQFLIESLPHQGSVFTLSVPITADR